MKITVAYASQAKDTKELENKYGKYCITKSACLDRVTLLGKYSNTQFLPKVYNAWLNKEDDITVLVHDDVCIRDDRWIEKLQDGLKKYDVVGLAGGSNATISEPCLWHIMCKKDTLRGRVSHVTDDGKGTFVTHFGPSGRVLMLDGLFIAFNTKKIINAGVKFDESNPAGFHFYDIDFSLACNSKKLKIGTVDIDVVHNSPGLRSFSEEWLSGQVWFKNKVNDGKYS